MSALEFVAGVVVLFFLIGTGVGVIAIMAMSATRHDRERRRNPGPGPRRDGSAGPSYHDEAGSNEPPLATESAFDDEGDDGPHWPDSGYRT
jgi:hypothetical protein